MKNGFKFLSGEDGDRHLSALGKFQPEDFKHRSLLKLWPGQFLGVYRFESRDSPPTVLAKIRVIDILADGDGLLAKLMHCDSGRMCLVRHTPVPIYSDSIGAYFPHRTFFERTVKIVDGGQPIYNIATGMWLVQKTIPHHKVPHTDIIDTWFNLERLMAGEKK